LKSSNLWSPYPPSFYTVMVDGEPAGLGAREEFIDRPGLWNMFWLHSAKVDLLLDWPVFPEQAPMHTAALTSCVASASYACHGISLETLCEFLPAEDFIKRMVDKNYQPPIRVFWDAVTNGWLGFVTDRLKSFKTKSKRKGVVIQGRFPLQSGRG